MMSLGPFQSLILWFYEYGLRIVTSPSVKTELTKTDFEMC